MKTKTHPTTRDDLSVLIEWKQSLYGLLHGKYRLNTRHRVCLYRPGRNASDAMLRLSVDFPHLIQQIENLLRIADTRREDLEQAEYDFSSAAATKFVGALLHLNQRLGAVLGVIDERMGTIKRQTPDGNWCHTPDEPRPDHFNFGSMTGTAIFLNECIGGKHDRNALQLHNKGRRGLLWIVKRDRTTCEVWFQNQGEIEAAKRRAEALKTPALPKKARRK